MESVATKDREEDIRNGGAEEAAEKSRHVKAEAERRPRRDAGAEQENGQFLLDRPCCADADDPEAPDEPLGETDSSEQGQRLARAHARARATAKHEGERHLSGVDSDQQRIPERQIETEEAG